MDSSRIVNRKRPLLSSNNDDSSSDRIDPQQPQQPQQYSNSSKYRNHSKSPIPPPLHRNILLFDLDCFYAQCYCIRLGYDVTTTALALFQWNSVLAVTYPARTLYHIERGDTWENVATKSQQQCICVHVPISTISSNHCNDDNNDNSNSNSHTNEATCNDDSFIEGTTNDELLLQRPSNSHHESMEAVVPATTTTTTTTKRKTLQEEYQELFQLTKGQQQNVRDIEINVRKYSTQGKANIEIFRIASAMILQLVHTCIQEYNNNNNHNNGGGEDNSPQQHSIVLERASIDEFFVDVTHHVHHQVLQQQQRRQSNNNNDNTDINEAMKHTVIISERKDNNHNNNGNEIDQDEDEEEDIDVPVHSSLINVNQNDYDDDDSILHLQHSCFIAYQIRQRVYHTLGFHMSAGIGINKTLAKLAASYGKPAGQAVLYPHNIIPMLHRTPIKKCRHLGGKVGKQLLSLLPPNVPPTIGSVMQYVSLLQMKQVLSSIEMAQKIYDLIRGMDHEPVESKTPDSSAVLTKSITAFKSLRFSSSSGTTTGSNDNNNNNFANGHTLIEAMKWIDLLVKEIVSRVDRDTQRNERYPKNLVIQYYSHTDTNTKYSHQNNKSIRVSYPSYQLTNDARIRLLLSIVPNTLQEKVLNLQKSVSFRFHRIGLCATDFESIKSGSKGIDTYFSAAPTTTTLSNNNNNNSDKVSPREPLTSSLPNDHEMQQITDISNGKIPSDNIENSNRLITTTTATFTTLNDTHGTCSTQPQHIHVKQNKEEDDDFIMAQKLQEAYDHEHRALQVMEKKRNNTLSSSMNHHHSRKQPPPTIRKINSFFQKK